ncbi:MAG: hypothetical protein J6O60_09815 [Lachnospiraceae bacterium]|nr:hypothetical protein [Lachnospiraceae bacterium]
MNSFTVSAEEQVRTQQPVELNTTEGLDAYIHWNDDGKTIYLDEGAAKNVGYTDSVIQYVEGNIDRMNRLVAEGYEIEEGYTVTVYPDLAGKRMLKASKANNVKGITTIIN